MQQPRKVRLSNPTHSLDWTACQYAYARIQFQLSCVNFTVLVPYQECPSLPRSPLPPTRTMYSVRTARGGSKNMLRRDTSHSARSRALAWRGRQTPLTQPWTKGSNTGHLFPGRKMPGKVWTITLQEQALFKGRPTLVLLILLMRTLTTGLQVCYMDDVMVTHWNWHC